MGKKFESLNSFNQVYYIQVDDLSILLLLKILKFN